MRLTDKQRGRLGKHLENRLSKIGVEWDPTGLPCAGPIKILEQEEWPPVLTLPQGQVDGLVDAKELLKDGTYEMHFRGFYLLFYDGITHAKLFKVAIHEGAHVIYWYERMRAAGNRFTSNDLNEIQQSMHGREFELIELRLLGHAKNLGFGQCGDTPEDVADLFV